MDPRPPAAAPRPPRADELPDLAAIEEAADRRFDELGIGPFAPVTTPEWLAEQAAVLVVGEPVAGFVTLEVVDGAAHISQLSVHPSSGRRGLGTQLVEGACAWAASSGHDAVTLTTFKDIPWNGPFYRRLGFREVDQLTPGLQAARDHERAIGDDAHGARIAMRRDLRA